MSFLRVEGIQKRFGSLSVLKGVSMQVAQGQVAVIIGPSGSGKSTLLRCLNALERAEAGSVWLDGSHLPAQGPDVRRWRESIGFVFQSFNLFPHLRVLDNVALPLRLVKKLPVAQAESLAHEALQRVGLSDKTTNYPDELSGGQQQRVAIARALALHPKLMLFDEPTSALDPELTSGVLDVMAGLAQGGMTMLVVTHEMGFARKVADTVHFMHEGAIIESGPPEHFFEHPTTLECQSFMNSILH